MDDLRQETFLPILRSHPFLKFYSIACPVGMKRLCTTGIEEISMLPMEELFWHGDDVNRMFFVSSGSLTYNHAEACALPIRVGACEWACEETLWASHSILSGPFVVEASGCELIMVKPSEFHAIARLVIETCEFVVRYAKLFLEKFNAAGQDDTCMDLLFNNPDTIGALVNEAAEIGAAGEDVLERSLPMKAWWRKSTRHLGSRGP